MTAATAEKTFMGLRDVHVVDDQKIETCGVIRVNGTLRVDAMVYRDAGHAWAFEGYARPQISPNANRVAVDHIMDTFRF
jgi:hypothetical protein